LLANVHQEKMISLANCGENSHLQFPQQIRILIDLCARPVARLDKTDQRSEMSAIALLPAG
jgi:hypothetical protein